MKETFETKNLSQNQEIDSLKARLEDLKNPENNQTLQNEIGVHES